MKQTHMPLYYCGKVIDRRDSKEMQILGEGLWTRNVNNMTGVPK